MGEGNEDLVYPSSWDFKSFFTCRKISRHGTSGFNSHPKEGVPRILVPLKFIDLAGIEPTTFGSSDKHTNHYTTKESDTR
jgi:hypothetical protein